jgi:hypothetical protein
MNQFLSIQTLKKTTKILSIGIFVCALTQKCYCTSSSCGQSILALFLGTIGIAFGGAALTWFANPLLIASWLITKKPKASLICSLFALMLSLSFLLFKNVVSDEGGNYSSIVSYQLGYWLWVTSSSMMFIGNCLAYFLRQKSETEILIERQDGPMSGRPSSKTDNKP